MNPFGAGGPSRSVRAAQTRFDQLRLPHIRTARIRWFIGRKRLNPWVIEDSGDVTGVHSMLRTFKYDAENRQTSATIDDVKTTYRYDGLGQRVQKIAGTTTTTYVYDAGGNLAAEYSTAIVASGCGTAVCYVTTDHLGSTRLLTDASGNPAKRYDYSPFGVELFVGTGGRSVNDGYTAQQLETPAPSVGDSAAALHRRFRVSRKANKVRALRMLRTPLASGNFKRVDKSVVQQTRLGQQTSTPFKTVHASS